MKKNRINPFYLVGGLIVITLAVVFFSVKATGVNTLDLSLVSLTILSGFCPLYVVLGRNIAKASEATN